jgi:hypothetical protein
MVGRPFGRKLIGRPHVDAGNGFGHQLHNEMGERSIERAIGVGEGFGRRLPHVDAWGADPAASTPKSRVRRLTLAWAYGSVGVADVARA